MRKMYKSIISLSLVICMIVTGGMGVIADETETTSSQVKLSAPKLVIKAHYEKNVKLTWSKSSGASSYLVYRAAKGKKLTLIKTTKHLTYTDKSSQKRKTYKYQIVASKKVNGVTYKSEASNSKTTYVKPKKPKIVICGECFVEGMKLFAKKYKPKNTKLVYKVGLSTYGLLNTNCKKYKGRTVTPLERVAYYKPDRVFFLIGMNEASNKSPSKTVKNYKKAFNLLKRVNPHIEMVLMGLPPVGRSHSSGFASNKAIKKYNKAYKKFAKKTSNVFYYGSYRKILTNGAGYLKASANGGDGGHWSAGATRKVMKHLRKYSKKLTRR